LVEEIANIRPTVVSIVQQHAKEIIANALGFSSSFGRWEVDHCNARQSAIGNALGEAALEQIQMAIPDFIFDYKAILKKEDFLLGAGRRDYKEQMVRRLSQHMDKWVEEESLRQSKELIETLKASKPKEARQD
jgi:hypothetical protein